MSARVGAVTGDQYTYVALSASSRAIVSYLTGKRSSENTDVFIQDIRARVIGAPEISTDVHNRPDEDDGSHPAEIVCEEITKYGAVELLFPPALRLPAKAKIASNEATLFTVGESMHISENLVEFTLTDWYMDLSTRLRGDGPDRERFKPAPAARKRS